MEIIFLGALLMYSTVSTQTLSRRQPLSSLRDMSYSL